MKLFPKIGIFIRPLYFTVSKFRQSGNRLFRAFQIQSDNQRCPHWQCRGIGGECCICGLRIVPFHRHKRAWLCGMPFPASYSSYSRTFLGFAVAVLGRSGASRRPAQSASALSCVQSLRPYRLPSLTRITSRRRGQFPKRPQLTKQRFFTHKRTDRERYAALRNASGCARRARIPSIFSDVLCSAPERVNDNETPGLII